MTEPEVRVPVGRDASRWVTVGASRTVLAVARTLTSTVRVLDAVDLLAGDHRVQVIFAVNDSSPFTQGVRPLLDQIGARVVPWPQLRRLHVDAAVTASENTELDAIDAPVLVLPHGVGFHKYLPDSRGGGNRLSGSLRSLDLRDRHVLVALSHPEQEAHLLAHSPAAAGRTVVIADPVVERLRASSPFRYRYRQALGTGDRRLVVLTSTWGRQSLLGRWPDLPARLLAALPADEYQVAAVLHPNIWAGHGPWQVRAWLADAREAGLALVPPQAGWPAALVAADCVVSDHGSVSLYAAALDRPLLLAPFGDETVPGTPMADLGRLADRLEPDRSPYGQIVATIARHRPGRYQDPVRRSFVGAPQARPLRGVLYSLLSLPEPAYPAPLRGWPPPPVEHRPPGAYAVHTRRTADTIEIRRIPATVDRSGGSGTARWPGGHTDRELAGWEPASWGPADPEGGIPAGGSGGLGWGCDDARTGPGPGGVRAGWSRHLAVYEREWDPRLVESASVVVCDEPAGAGAADAWVAATLARLPGSRLAAAAITGGCLIGVRGGGRVRVSAPGGGLDPMLLAASAYTLLVTGGLAAARLLLRVGAASIPVTIEPG